MTDTGTTATYSKLKRDRVKRGTRYDIMLSPTEREQAEAAAKEGGFNSVADYIRHRVFGKPTGAEIRDQQRVGGAMFTDLQMCEIAVAVVHQYGYLRTAFENEGKGAAFEEDRKRVIDALGLQKVFGAGE